MVRRAGLAFVAFVITAGTSSAAVAPRLDGAWNVTGRYVVAENLRDRNVGDTFTERWTFSRRCKGSVCDVRLRRFGRTIVLTRTRNSWTGTERFTGRFYCGDRVYPAGTDYVAQWTVVATRTALRSGRPVVTRFRGVGATIGRSRDGIPCARVTSREGVTFTAAPAR